MKDFGELDSTVVEPEAQTEGSSSKSAEPRNDEG
jgi:hypothetical protein